LVNIVGGTALEHHIDGHVVAMIVHGASEVSVQGPHGEVHNAFVIAEVLVAGTDQLLYFCGRCVMQREVNHVGQWSHNDLKLGNMKVGKKSTVQDEAT
jgi:hypothetical protein